MILLWSAPRAGRLGVAGDRLDDPPITAVPCPHAQCVAFWLEAATDHRILDKRHAFQPPNHGTPACRITLANGVASPVRATKEQSETLVHAYVSGAGREQDRMTTDAAPATRNPQLAPGQKWRLAGATNPADACAARARLGGWRAGLGSSVDQVARPSARQAARVLAAQATSAISPTA
jgi:hypothetical protein